MTTRPTDEEISALINDVAMYAAMAAYATSGNERTSHNKGLEKAKQKLRDAWLAERQTARNGVIINEREAFDVLVDTACEAINKIHKVGKKRFKADMTAVVKAVIEAQARAALDQRQEVTDDLVYSFLKAQMDRVSQGNCTAFDSVKAALQSIAQPVKVPDAKEPVTAQDEAYADGWNACRDAMLSTSPQPQQAVPDWWVDELLLINAVLKGYFPSIARNDALRSVQKMLSAAPAYNGKKEG